MRSCLKLIFLGTILLLGGCSGCKVGEKYQKPQTDPAATNQLSTGFNEESYIWESWKVPKPRK